MNNQDQADTNIEGDPRVGDAIERLETDINKWKHRAERAEAEIESRKKGWKHLIDDFDQMKERAERAEACVAEMREALEVTIEWLGPPHEVHCPQDDTCDCAKVIQVKHALSTDFGQGWASPDTVAKWEKEREHVNQQRDNWEARADKLQAENQFMRDALEKIAWQKQELTDPSWAYVNTVTEWASKALSKLNL